MSVKKNTKAILQELINNLSLEDDGQLNELVSSIVEAKHIFLAGAGRSGIAIRAFANRLMHLGKSVSIVGEITSPHTKTGDLLIIGSGSGETESLRILAEKAQKIGVKIVLVTMDPNSSIAKMASLVVVLPGDSPKLHHFQNEVKSIQPMGSAFEQLMFLTFDGAIIDLMDKLNQTSEEMFERHANLE